MITVTDLEPERPLPLVGRPLRWAVLRADTQAELESFCEGAGITLQKADMSGDPWQPLCRVRLSPRGRRLAVAAGAVPTNPTKPKPRAS